MHRPQKVKNQSTSSHMNNLNISDSNSLGKKSLNISHQYNDSSLFEMNPSSLNKYKLAQHFNLTSILRQNLLEDDGIEDMHFY